VTDGSDPARPEGGDDDLRRHSALVAAGIGLSRVSGLVREAATAYFLGTGVAADAFKAALRIPNLLQNLLGEGVLSASFIPVYSQARAEGRDRDAGALAGAVAGLLLLVTSLVVLVGVVFAPAVTRLFVPGWAAADPERFELTVTMVRILTPGVGFLVLSAWCLGVLNSHRHFFLSYVAPVLWNVSIVTALAGTALLVTDATGSLAVAMAIGAAVGSVAQFAIQVPTVRRLAPDLRLSLHLGVPGVRTVLRRFGQVLAGRGSVQLASYVDLILASLLAAGAVAALTFAQALYLLPIALFGMAVAAAELPTLSTMDQQDRRGVVARLDAGLGRVAFFVLPSAVAFLVLGDLVVGTIYEGNRFTADATAQVGAILSVLSLGMLAATSSRLLQSSLYGGGDARTPALYATIKVVVSLSIGVTLMFPLDGLQLTADGLQRVGDLGWSVTEPALRSGSSAFRLGAVGLALGGVLGAWLEWALLRQRVRIVYGPTRLLGPHGRRQLVAAAVAVVAAFGARWLVGVFELPGRVEGLVALAVTGAVYVLAAHLLRLPEASALLRQVRLLR
jgi:putative peptidoglycan lipid II flippase